MKKGILLTVFLFLNTWIFPQNIGIGTSNPKAKLDVNGTFRIKRYSTAERDSMTQAGDMTDIIILNSDRGPYEGPKRIGSLQIYLNGSWRDFFLLPTEGLADNYYRSAGYCRYSYPDSVRPSWIEEEATINDSLAVYNNDILDTMGVLSPWIYRHTRVGHANLYVSRVFTNWEDTANALSTEWYYDAGESDTTVWICGDHSQYAAHVYAEFGCTMLMFSEGDSSYVGGHMINVIENPVNHEWYLIDHMYGVFYTHVDGRPLSVDDYMLFHYNGQLHDSVAYIEFGDYKYHIYPSACTSPNYCCYDPNEIIDVQKSNDPRYYRIIAPHKAARQFRHLADDIFDPLATLRGEPLHQDIDDLVKRAPGYLWKIWWPVSPNQFQADYADSLGQRWMNIRDLGHP